MRHEGAAADITGWQDDPGWMLADELKDRVRIWQRTGRVAWQNHGPRAVTRAERRQRKCGIMQAEALAQGDTQSSPSETAGTRQGLPVLRVQDENVITITLCQVPCSPSENFLKLFLLTGHGPWLPVKARAPGIHTRKSRHVLIPKNMSGTAWKVTVWRQSQERALRLATEDVNRMARSTPSSRPYRCFSRPGRTGSGLRLPRPAIA